MKKLMVAAMVAAGIVGAAEAATYDWRAMLSWYPEGVYSNPYYYDTRRTASGTIEAGYYTDWIGVWMSGSEIGATAASSYDALMATDEMSGAAYSVWFNITEGDHIWEKETIKAANAGFSGECLFVAQVEYKTGDYYDPIPEPTSAAMFLLGLAWMAARRKEAQI